jgi:ABC-type lipoprotein release transport system permease subunit
MNFEETPKDGKKIARAIQGAVEAVHNRYLSDVFVSTLKNHSYIERTVDISEFARNIPEVEAVTVRYVKGGSLEGNYKSLRKPKEEKEVVSTSIAGIDPEDENAVTNIKDKLVEGTFIEPQDYDQVVIGSSLLKKYMNIESENFPVLPLDIGIGSKIRVNIDGNQREVTIKGIVKTKVDEIDRRVFFDSRQFKNLINRYDYSANEIAIKVKNGADPVSVKDKMVNAGFSQYAKIQTADEAEPKFIKDMKNTFAILGNFISSIGLAVAAITVFIVIFINAITRRKFIGILKGIGITNLSIESSYVIQSIFYAFFAFSNGIPKISKTLSETFLLEGLRTIVTCNPMILAILSYSISGKTICSANPKL